jgi:DNA-binding NarL/FixJ family response regulator
VSRGQPVRIIIADAHTEIRSRIVSLLNTQSDLHVLGEADNSAETMTLVRQLRPDIAIVDITMPKLNAVHVLEQLSHEALHTRVIVFSLHDEFPYIARMFAAGARGYVSKKGSAEELIEGIRQVMSGQIFLSPHLRNYARLSFGRKKNKEIRHASADE